MEYKNKTIEFFGTKYKIKFVDSIECGEDILYGITYPDKREVIIATKMGGKDLPEEEIKLTLLHELLHSILITGQYLKENQDEPLVEWLARCINQLLKKKII